MVENVDIVVEKQEIHVVKRFSNFYIRPKKVKSKDKGIYEEGNTIRRCGGNRIGLYKKGNRFYLLFQSFLSE